MKAKMFSALLLIAALFSLSVGLLYAQSDPSREILVYFASGIDRAPAGQPASIRSAAIERLLTRFNIDRSQLVSAFPNFNEADTLKQLADGKRSGNGYLRVDVTDAQGSFASAQYYVQGAGGGGAHANLQGEQNEATIAKSFPVEFSIGSYPNPFNPSATIKYQLPADGVVKLSVFDVLGRQVEVLVNETKPAGFYTASFNASQLPSGIYFARLSVSSNEGKQFVQTIKMQLTK